MRVSWMMEAYDQLAGIYVTLSVVEQRALADTVARVEATLTLDPYAVGLPCGGTYREWEVPPVVVWFDVAARKVTIAAITRSEPNDS